MSSKREVRRVPSRTLMLRAFQIEAALPHLAWCRAGCSKTMCTQMLCDQNRPAAPRGFYLAIARSAVCASPVPHNSSLSCDLTRTRRSAQAAVSVQTHCSRYVDSLAGRTCVMFAKWTEARTQELHRLCPLFADRTQEDGKQSGRGQAHIPASHALTGQLLRLQWLMARPQPP